MKKEQKSVMPKFDITDEAIIDSQPITVYNAFLNELSGITQWWMPHLQCKSRDGKLIDCEGGIFEATIHPHSILKARVCCKIAKMVEAKSITVEYISGGFLGTGEYTFEPIDERTRIKFRFKVKSNNPLAYLVSPFMDIAKGHSDVMQHGFKNCNAYLKHC